MKYYTVVNEVKALQTAYAVCVCVCFSARVCALQREWGFVCQEVAVIMPPSRSEVFQGIMSLHVGERAEREVRFQRNTEDTVKEIHIIRSFCRSPSASLLMLNRKTANYTLYVAGFNTRFSLLCIEQPLIFPLISTGSAQHHHEELSFSTAVLGTKWESQHANRLM